MFVLPPLLDRLSHLPQLTYLPSFLSCRSSGAESVSRSPGCRWSFSARDRDGERSDIGLQRRRKRSRRPDCRPYLLHLVQHFRLFSLSYPMSHRRKKVPARRTSYKKEAKAKHHLDRSSLPSRDSRRRPLGSLSRRGDRLLSLRPRRLLDGAVRGLVSVVGVLLSAQGEVLLEQVGVPTVGLPDTEDDVSDWKRKAKRRRQVDDRVSQNFRRRRRGGARTYREGSNPHRATPCC